MENIPLSIIDRKVAEIASVAPNLPGIVTIHKLEDTSILYISQRGLDYLGVSLQEIKSLTRSEYQSRFFSDNKTNDYLPKAMSLLLKDNQQNDSISFLQQISYQGTQKSIFFISTMRVLLRDEITNKALLSITISQPIDLLSEMIKLDITQHEKHTNQKKLERYNKLGKREKQILHLLAAGKTSHDIASEMFISELTADTHRRNIKKKLGVNSLFEMFEFVKAFDFI